jgi:hypothetical protein
MGARVAGRRTRIGALIATAVDILAREKSRRLRQYKETIKLCRLCHPIGLELRQRAGVATRLVDPRKER